MMVTPRETSCRNCWNSERDPFALANKCLFTWQHDCVSMPEPTYFKSKSMTIKTGDSVPSGSFSFMGEKGPESITTDELFNGKKVVVFAVPGAFTPTCSEQHLPGFIANADKIQAKGADRIVCVSVNDPFVMGAWSKAQNTGEILMAADGSGTWTKAIGLELDLIERGLGVRSQRYSMIVNDGKVTHLNVEDGPVFEVSSAEKILEQL